VKTENWRMTGAGKRTHYAKLNGAVSDSEWSQTILHNVRDIRSFSETKWKKNLGEGRAEPRTVYPLLYAPTTERRRAQRSLSSKNIFRSYSSDRLSFISYKFDFFVLKNERGVRGEFHFSKLLILSR